MSIIITISITAIICLFAGMYVKGKTVQLIAALGIVIALALSFYGDCAFFDSYKHLYQFDAQARLFTQITLLTTFFIVLLSDYALKLQQTYKPEMYALLLFSLCGAFIMIGFQNLITLFVGIEVLSIPLYALAGSSKNDLRSNEASLKYFLMGAFATGFLLLGITFIYGATSSFDSTVISEFIAHDKGTFTMLQYGIAILGIGILFKISIAPFHFWSPDVYEGSPTIVTMFMAAIVKTAGFVALFNLVTILFINELQSIQYVLTILIVLTLLISNMMALIQKNAKRLMAYSSISHAGYLLIFFFNIYSATMFNVALYLLAYSLANIGVFLTIIYIERISEGRTDISNFNGLAKKEPILAFTTSVSLLSMAGIPLTGGFIAKLSLLLQAVETNLGLVLIAIIGSAISIAYYLKIITAMYFRKPSKTTQYEDNKSPLLYRVTAILISILILTLGIIIPPLIKFVNSYFI